MSHSQPAGLPALRRGRHRDPGDGSCLMEYVSVLAGERFSDRPRCTPRVLTWLAQRVNDAVSDAARPQLVLRAPLLARRVAADPTVTIVRTVARAGLELDPQDRASRRAWRLAERDAISWWRPDVRLRLLEAFLALDRQLTTRSGAERDSRLIAVLDEVLDTVHPVAERVPSARRGAAR